MTDQRRRFSYEEKMQILQEARQSKIMEILHKYNLSYSVFHRWRKQYSADAEGKPKTPDRKMDAKMKELAEENALLKKIIESQASLLELKEELQKRNSS